MTQTAGVAVTYTGHDDPFVDRLYRSGLTFTNGQTRTVPPTLAERLLRHADVFQRVKSAEELAAEAEQAQAEAGQAKAAAEALAKMQAEDAAEAERVAAAEAQAESERLAREASERAEAARLEAEAAAQRETDAATAKKSDDKPKDDTKEILDQAQKKDDDLRKQEDARFELLDQIDSMDKPALLAYAQDKYQQKLPANLGEAKLRERVKGFVDQYGAP
jgi:hypothetical protein